MGNKKLEIFDLTKGYSLLGSLGAGVSDLCGGAWRLTFEQTQDMFLAALGKRTGVEPWQIRQATTRVRIYRYQYRTDSAKSEKEKPSKALASNENDLLARLQEIIRLRHYAKSTEKYYLHWTRWFFAYRKDTGLSGEPTAADVKAFLTRLAMVEKVSASTRTRRSVHYFFFSGTSMQA